MDDKLKKLLAEMREDLHAVQAEQRGMRENVDALRQRMDTSETRFSNFVARFDEAAEMLVQHDTEQLQRVTSVETENAQLRDQWKTIRAEYAALAARVEALEKKAG